MASTPEFDPTKVSVEMYKAWEKAMGEFWDQILESPTFLDSMGKNLSASARARATYEKVVDEALSQAHLPTRTDITRVGRVAVLLEERLLQMEDRILTMQDRMSSLEKEALQARIEAAEARLELADRLGRIEGLLTSKVEPKVESKVEPKVDTKADDSAARKGGKKEGA